MQQTLWAKRSCCVRAPLERNLEAAEGDRTEAAVRLVNARCILEIWIAVLGLNTRGQRRLYQTAGKAERGEEKVVAKVRMKSNSDADLELKKIGVAAPAREEPARGKLYALDHGWYKSMVPRLSAPQ